MKGISKRINILFTPNFAMSTYEISPINCPFHMISPVTFCNEYFLSSTNPNQERKNSKFVVEADILSWGELAPS